MIESFGLTVMLFCSVNFVEDAISSIICCSEQLAKNNIIIIYTNQFFILNFLFFILTQHSIGLLGIVSSSISCFVCFMRIYQSFVCHIPRPVLIYLRPVISSVLHKTRPLLNYFVSVCYSNPPLVGSLPIAADNMQLHAGTIGLGERKNLKSEH